ncbi:MAG TPA: Uma2 family endonuclease [Blastocatellia bacterium]|nr:Uma2 family endonuclease [Blastocatellia bacterium]
MSLPKSQLLVTPEKYLAFEREAVERHEWLDGLIYAMAGESPQHSIICSNINAELNLQLRGKPCTVFSPNMKTRAVPIPARGLEGLFAYPDTMVVCGKPIFHDEHQDVIINPKVIVEVLSKSTSRYDHEEKFERYAGNKSLTDYLLVSQKRPHIQHLVRKPRGRWELVIETKLSGSILIASIRCRPKLANVYDRIEFPPLDLIPTPLNN